MKELGFTFAAVAAATFLLTALAERVLIPILRSHKLGQVILDIGPRWHKSKEGTPTMGGIGFILASLVVMAVYFIIRAVRGEGADYIPLALTLAYGVANGAVGFVDDYCKLVKKQNEGLTRLQKLLLQVVLAAAYVCIMAYTGHMSTVLQLPFTDKSVDLGFAYYLMAVVVLTGVVNGGNITDGIDGLASAVTCIIGVFYAFWGFTALHEQLLPLSAILIGASLGFLVYNFYPARVFMGDTGSLFFGALTIGCAFMVEHPLAGLLVTAVFVIEMLSSFLQIFYFRITHGKRLFKMAPLHHHFEKCGWSEIKVVVIFALAELVFCCLAWLSV